MNYEKLIEKTKASKYIDKLIKLNKYLPLFYIIAYIIVCITLFKKKDGRLPKIIMVPLFVYISITIMRKMINRQRPYDRLGVEPVIKSQKDRPGFPSRHTGSAFIISLAVAAIHPMGKLLFIPATVLAVLRVMFGLHYISDVAAGAIYALLTGFIGFGLF